MLWQASSLKAVRCCGRVLHNDAVGDPDDGQSVVVKRREVDGRMVASLHGLMTCGSVWACPRCSAVIANTRAVEIGAAVRECYRRGGRAYLLTLTMRHSRRDGLADLWDSLSKGWRSVFGTRHWTGQKERTVQRKRGLVLLPEIMGDAERFDIAGITRVVEATYGKPELGGHGWHLHIHALVFSATSLSSGLIEDIERTLGCKVDRDWLSRNAFAARIYQRWSQGLVKAGCRMPGTVAVDVREIDDEGAEYVGRYLSKATYDAATRIGLEMGAGVSTKDARAERNQTPFELLADLAESVDARGFGIRTPRHWAVLPADGGDWAVIDKDTGEVVNVTAPGQWKIWHEWEQASSGRRQIMWSRRRKEPESAREVLWNSLLDSRGVSAAASDEEVAVEEVHGEEVAVINRAAWYQVFAWRPSLIVDLLESVERLSSEDLLAWSQLTGIELIAAPPHW
ncbi:protein rep [Mycobacteroides abscessus]|uniref:protein rep n=1 Tax=Mycobacteroides abscessus TaxID=36809 RepID=UPI001F28D216|nr:protein rep [Mycobacteroides abscessus]